MIWTVTTPATGTVLSWEQLKAQIKPGSISEQPLIMETLAEVTAYAESMMECCLLPQTITATYGLIDMPYSGPWGLYQQVPVPQLYNSYNIQGFVLPRGPVLSITSVTDTNGNAVPFTRETAGFTEYVVPSATLYATQYPITIVYEAGCNSVPLDVAGAIRVLTATRYQYRAAFTNLPANDVAKLDTFFKFKGRGTSVA